MPIITISRGSYSQAKEVAEKVARQLGFECVSREVLVEASEEFNVPEIKILRAIRDAPSALDRFTFSKERYTSYIQAALLEHFQKDNVVYHGLAGHHFVRGVSHVLKVRIIGNMEDRAKLVMRRGEVFEQAASAMRGLAGHPRPRHGARLGMSMDDAMRVLKEVDEARRKWGFHLFGIDTHDASIYDLVVHIHRLSTDDAADLIRVAAMSDRLKATPESRQIVDDLLLGARARAKLIERYPRADVTAQNGDLYVALEGGSSSDQKAIQDAVAQVPGVERVNVDVYPLMTPD